MTLIDFNLERLKRDPAYFAELIGAPKLVRWQRETIRTIVKAEKEGKHVIFRY